MLAFVPQIIIMFLITAFPRGVGYMSRVAFLMGWIMNRVGLGGRVLVALLSSFACAIPEIMATCTLPSAKDQVTTMLTTPLITCSARLPVHILLAPIMVPADAKTGPLSARDAVMFALCLLGAVSATMATWMVKHLIDRGGMLLSFYMKMPPYRMPRLRTILIIVWDACKGSVKEAGMIITLTTVILWILLNVSMRSRGQFSTHYSANAEYAAVSAAVENPASSITENDDGKIITDPRELSGLLDAQKTSYMADNSQVVAINKTVQPVLKPLGFGWRINVATPSSLAARETFMATLGQITATEDPERPSAHLVTITYRKDTLTNRVNDRLFNPAAITTILVLFAYVLQCMVTAAATCREIGT